MTRSPNECENWGLTATSTSQNGQRAGEANKNVFQDHHSAWIDTAKKTRTVTGYYLKKYGSRFYDYVPVLEQSSVMYRRGADDPRHHNANETQIVPNISKFVAFTPNVLKSDHPPKIISWSQKWKVKVGSYFKNVILKTAEAELYYLWV